VDALLDALSAEGPLEEDEIPPVPKAAVTRPGEVVELGEHRLACGDARDADLVARLMQAEVADCVVTDPPYGVAYEGKTRRRLRLVNDHVDGLPALLAAAFGVVDRRVASGAAVYVFHPTGGSLPVFMDAFVAVGWELRQSLVWAKDAINPAGPEASRTVRWRDGRAPLGAASPPLRGGAVDGGVGSLRLSARLQVGLIGAFGRGRPGRPAFRPSAGNGWT
jgi:hypothetical protein